MKLGLLVATALATFATLSPGCADNPVTPEEHFEARGVIVSIGDSTVVTVDSNRVTGTIRLDSVGQTRLLRFQFILDDGRIALPTHEQADEDGLALDVRSADTSAVAIADVDQHDWSATLSARRSAVTSLSVALLHGGHDDFVSPAIPVVVAP